MPLAPLAWIDALAVRAPVWGIKSALQEAHFVAQLAHECNQFQHVEENLYYTPVRLCQVWPRRFPTLAAAEPYARNPEKLGNLVYANRLGNGPPESGDGYRYRGRGPIQITGRDNYAAAGTAIAVDLVNMPNAVLRPLVGCDVAGWFWQSRNLNELADADNLPAITLRINGGSEGIESRRAWLTKAKTILRVE